MLDASRSGRCRNRGRRMAIRQDATSISATAPAPVPAIGTFARGQPDEAIREEEEFAFLGCTTSFDL